MPRPATCGSGSSRRRRPGRPRPPRSASAQGGVRPWWAHGSSVTYAVAPRARSPAAASATDLGVRPARRLRGALADDGAVADQDAAHPGVRGRTAPAALAERDRPSHQLGARLTVARGTRRRPSASLRLAAPGPAVPARAARGERCRRARGVRPSALSHPDSHRRPRLPAQAVRTGSTTRPAAVGSRAPAVADGRLGRLPPVGTCTQPRGLTRLCASSTIPSYRGPRMERCSSSSFTGLKRRRPRSVSGGGRRRAGRGRAGRRGGPRRGTPPRPTAEPGRLQTSAAPTVPQTPRESIPKGRPPALLARRIASARPGASRSITARVPSGVRSRGPNPVPPVVTTSPAKPRGQLAERGGDRFDAVAARSRGRSTVEARGDEPLDERACPTCRRGVPSATPSETVRTLATSDRRGRLASCDAPFSAGGRERDLAELAGGGGGVRSAWKIALPATRMSTPAATAAGAVSSLMPPSISISTGKPCLVDHGAGGAHLVEDVRDERLTAEPGVHAHHEQQVDLAEVRQHRVDRRLGVQREPDADAAVAQLGRTAGAGRRARRGRCSGRRRPRRSRRAARPGCRPSGGSRGRDRCACRSDATTGGPIVRFGTK